GDAGHGIGEVEVQFGLEVGPPLGPGTPGAATAPPPAEQVAQHVADPPAGPREVAGVEGEGAAAGPAESTGAARPAESTHGPHGPGFVVLLALIGVTYDLVGRGDLLEALLGCCVTRVGVGVVLPRQLAIGAGDLLGVGRRRDTEDRVVVLLEPLALNSHG